MSEAGAAVLTLARAPGLSTCDARYLKLAQRRAAPLATLDRRLAAATAAEGVNLIAGQP